MEMDFSPQIDFDKQKIILSYCNCDTSANKQKWVEIPTWQRLLGFVIAPLHPGMPNWIIQIQLWRM